GVRGRVSASSFDRPTAGAQMTSVIRTRDGCPDEVRETRPAPLRAHSHRGDGSPTEVMAPVHEPSRKHGAIPTGAIRDMRSVPGPCTRHVTFDTVPSLMTSALDDDGDVHSARVEPTGRDDSADGNETPAEPQAHRASVRRRREHPEVDDACPRAAGR